MGLFSKKVKTAPQQRISSLSKDDKMVDNNLKGKELEKSGKIDAAIKLYEENVRLRCQGNHPYDRLAIIYHKRKDYKNEKRVLEIAIDVFEHDVYKNRGDRVKKLNRFKERLEKTEKIIKEEK